MRLLLLLGLGLMVGMGDVVRQTILSVLFVWRLRRRHVILEAFHERRIHKHTIRFQASVDVDERIGRVEKALADVMWHSASLRLRCRMRRYLWRGHRRCNGLLTSDGLLE